MALGFDNERCKDKGFGCFRGVEEERLRDGLSFGGFSGVEEERFRDELLFDSFSGEYVIANHTIMMCT